MTAEGDFMIYLAKLDRNYCEKISAANRENKPELLADLGDEYQDFVIKSLQTLLKMARELDEQAKTRSSSEAEDLIKQAEILRDHSSMYANRHSLIDRMQKTGKLPSNLPIFEDDFWRGEKHE
jgi:hypothetical protein